MYMKNIHNIIRLNLYTISRFNAARRLRTADLDTYKIIATCMVPAQQLYYKH